MAICYLGIGSNLGNRRKNIESAVKIINSLKHTKALKLSRIIETKAVGGPSDQPKFLNAALKIRTRLSPLVLLTNLKQIESELGRIKTVRWGPRPIDLDILFYGNRIMNTKQLKIPHPRAFERSFVLKPLSEII
ncbi:MAG: 2-amino-4-hydroxy-6-hydroxymethyldihydropteridine diphosphokinase [Candidatus Omnitrophica bacterium]|jgi:2-amino-4-hydroxy-6-hydroxymethyldihydropteridine diphosphokinase|nr:2-amino-4-hydroxy-6-hydroxymethyldihydropteridine diphosphokinase [Candidatus Omnitrophota bacterium]